jgi:hypothetical protein
VVRRTIEKHTEISRVNLVRKCSSRGIPADQMSRALDTLTQAHLIEDDIVGRKGGKIYRWLGK